MRRLIVGEDGDLVDPRTYSAGCSNECPDCQEPVPWNYDGDKCEACIEADAKRQRFLDNWAGEVEEILFAALPSFRRAACQQVS